MEKKYQQLEYDTDDIQVYIYYDLIIETSCVLDVD